MTEQSEYEVAVVGGGPAGLSAALYTTRLGHSTVLFDRGGGRAAMMQDTHNVVGVTEDVSGMEYLQTGLEQVKSYGGDHVRELVTDVEAVEGGFRLEANETVVTAEQVVLATGFNDGRPSPPAPRTARGLHYCLHCDAYMFVDAPVYVMGTGNSAAYVSMIMLNFTPDVDLLLNGADPEWDDDVDALLQGHPVDIVTAEIESVSNDSDGWLEAMSFANGETRKYRGGFAMYGSNYNTDLAESIGCTLTDDGTIEVDDHGRTTVDGVYAVGDVTPGHNQVPVAVGEGAKAGLAIHKELRTFPLSHEELTARGEVGTDEVPAMSEQLRELARAHESNVGVRIDETADD